MIVVTGATGSIGRYLLRHLGDRGAELRALVRDPSRGEQLGVPYVVADFDEPGTLAPAFAGADRLFLNGAVGETMAAQQKAVVDAAVAAGVEQIVRVSSAGAGVTSDRAISRWHGEVDEHLERCPVSSAVLQPTFFTQNLLSSASSVRAEGKLYGGFGEGRLAFVDCSDIAACAAALLTGAPTSRGAFVLTGPEALSFADVAGRLSAKLGRPVSYVNRPVPEIVASMKARGAAPSIADSFGRMMEAMAHGAASPVTSAVARLTGRAPRTVDAFLDDHLDQFR